MLKDWLRPFVRPLPQWSAVGIAPPSQVVTASLRWHGKSADVTADHTVASLRPLTIATSLDAGAAPVLEYGDSATGRVLGSLRLWRSGSVMADGASVSLYQVVAGDHHCLRWPRRSWNAWLQNRAMLKQRASNHLNMEPAAAQQLMIAYLCPRPVVLVSVDTPTHHNIFPMDLIGPLNRIGLFSLALRSTNVSEPILREIGQAALSSMPASMKATVYQLSAHHKEPLNDWSELSFATHASSKFAIPTVAEALRVRDLMIVHSQQIGSHTFFLCRVASDEYLHQGEQLHHTAGFHQAYRRARGEPFAEV
jgi:flavin reductase (DIM6/NTAB) family NADH-FMN oxidoreductase RutF